MIKPKMNVKIPVDNVKGIGAIWADLEAQSVLVGVPEAKAPRKAGDKANNALLAYIHDNGSPRKGIPPRPFLGAGIKEGKNKIVAALGKVATARMKGRPVTLDAVGLVAVNAVRAKITRGPFTPLAKSTLARRRAKGFRGTKPLIETGQLRAAQNYVVVKNK